MKTIKLILWLLIIYTGLTAQALALTITKSDGWLETAYVQWSPVSGASSYKVYYTGGGKTAQEIDTELIRQYSSAGYWRADVLGLKAGSYTVKIEAYNSSGSKLEEATTGNLTVTAHDRSGFAFSSASGSFGSANGAYNSDGTLKTDAKIVYVTAANAKTVTATIKTTASKTTDCTGIQAILTAQGKGYGDPLAIRIIGKITDSEMDGNLNGSTYLQIKGSSADTDMKTTMEGVGNDATMKGWGLLIRNSTNVEIRNLAVMGDGDDGISLDTDNKNIWVHNCDVFYGKDGGGDKAKGDGGIDCKKSAWITVSYIHYWDSGKCNLLSNGGETAAYHTFHHNFFDHADSRLPRVRDHWAHVYNNYYVGNPKYGIGAAKGCAKVFAENNYFVNCTKPMLISQQGTDVANGAEGTFSGENGGMIKAYNNIMEGTYTFVPYSQNNTEFDAYVVTSRTATIPNTVKAKQGGCTYDNFDTDNAVMGTSVYPCKLDPVENVPAVVQQWAGRCEHGDLQFQFTDADNKDYSRMSGISNLLANYEPSGEIEVYNPNTGASIVDASVPTIALQSGNTSQNLQAGEAMTNLVYQWGGTATTCEITYQTNGGTASSTKPSWLTVTSSTNKTVTFSGTPEVVNNASTTYTITIKGKKDSSTSSSLTATITVVPLTPGTLTLTSIVNTDSQSVEAGHPITDIVYTWGGGATGVTVTGLDNTGLASTINTTNKTVTIGGTPTGNAGSTISYTVTTSGGSTQVSNNGTINITAPTSPSVTLTSGSADQSVIVNKPVTNIVYTAGGTATSISVASLPDGITGNINGLVLTISGTPNTAGTYIYIVTTTAQDGTKATTTGTITVNDAVACNTTPFNETFANGTALNTNTDESGYVVGGGSPSISNGILTMTGARLKTKTMNLTGGNVTLTVKVRPVSSGDKKFQIALDAEGTSKVSGLGNYTMSNLENLVGDADFATIVISVAGGTENSYIHFRTESGTTVEVDEITITQTCGSSPVELQPGCGEVTINDRVYGQKESTPQVSSNCQGTTGVTYKYTGINGTVYAESLTVPVNAGEYRVLAVFPANNIYSEATASSDFVIDKAKPEASLFECSGSDDNIAYDGNTHSVSVTSTETGMGLITVKYNGSATAPASPGTYKISVDVMEGENYYATPEDIELCTLNINTELKTPVIISDEANENSFVLSWGAVENADGYEVKVCPVGVSESDGGTPGTPFTQTFNDYSGTTGTDITESFTLGKMTVNATAEKPVRINSGSGTVGDNILYTKYIDLRGGSSVTTANSYRSVTFEIDGTGTLTIYSNARNSARTLILWDGTTASSITENEASFEISAGTYWLYSSSGGIQIYAIDFAGKENSSEQPSGCLIKTTDANTTGITIDRSELDSNTTYTYQVRAIRNNNIVSAYTPANQFNALSASEDLAVPTGVTSSSVTANSFELSWVAVDGATGYEVKVCPEGATGDSGGGSTTTKDIVAYFDTKNSATLKTGDQVSIEVGTSSADCKDESINNETAYRSKDIDSSNDMVLTLSATDNVTGIALYGISNGKTERTFTSYTINDDIPVTSVSGKMGSTCGLAATITGLNLKKGDKIKFTFDGKYQINYFILTTIDSEGGEETQEGSCNDIYASSTSTTIDNLASDTKYTYRVKAVKGEEESDYSEEGYVTTLPANTQKESPTAAMFSCSNVSVIYDGAAKSVEVTTTEEGMGAITVKYFNNESETQPVAIGTYKIKISVAESVNYLAVENLELECTLTITAATTTLSAPANVQSSNITANSFDLSWDAVADATGYVVEVCHEEVTEGGGSEESVVKSLTLLVQSEISSLSDDNTGSILKTGNDITISQIGMKLDKNELQLNSTNTDLLLSNSSKDALLVHSSGMAIAKIEVTFAGSGNNDAQPFVGFSGNDYEIGGSVTTFSATDCDASKSVTGKSFVKQEYECPENTKSVIFVRAKNKECGSNKTVEKTILISEITVYLVPESNTGSETEVEIICKSDYETTETSITINDLEPDTEYTYKVKAVNSSGESDYTTGNVTTLPRITTTWKGISTDWNEKTNWDSEQAPTAVSDVIIPKLSEGKVYPLLTGSKENNVCKTITFEAGAEIGRQDLLTYEKAYVQYGFSDTGSRDRWIMLSSPLQGVVAGDFAYGGYPKTFLRKFDATTSPKRTVTMGTWTNAIPNYDTPLGAGEGFVLWVNGSNSEKSSELFGLDQTGGIIQLPFFEDPVISGYHRIHTYENGKSTFKSINKDLEIIEGNTTEVKRDPSNYKLNDDITEYSVEFSQAVTATEEEVTVKPFAFIGNPFMTTIDFTKIYEASKDNEEKYRIKPSYQIWTGATFVTYSSSGSTGDENLTQYIAPQQAFLVEKAEDYEETSFTFDFTVEDFSASSQEQQEYATLRSSSVPHDKLDIVASNDRGSILTFIAKREYGSMTFGNNDTRKLVTGVNAMPEIYSLKESSSGLLIAAGSNVINTDNALIPLGLSTSWEGDMKLTFKGMDRYNAQIKFIDLVAGQEINLTEESVFEYTFDYTPAKDDNNKALANESRFFIQFTPTAPTGLSDTKGTTRVYNDKQAVYIVSSDKIQRVFIYDLRGNRIYANHHVQSSHLTIPKKFNSSEVYIVKVATENGIKNVKLINK